MYVLDTNEQSVRVKKLLSALKNVVLKCSVCFDIEQACD